MSARPKNEFYLIDRLPILERCIEAQRAISRAVTILARPSSEALQDDLFSLHFRLGHLIEGVELLEAADKELHQLRLVRNTEGNA